MSDTRLALYVETRPILVASRLRVAMERRGFAALPPESPVPHDGFTVVVRRTGPADCWIHPDHPDAVPEELGRLLSHELRCRVTTVAQLGSICAYEIAEAGKLVEKLAVDNHRVLESRNGRFAERVTGGESLGDLVAEAGWDGLRVSFEDAKAGRRPMVLGFAPLPGASGGEEIIIDPGLLCPVCEEAMRVIEGRFGSFFGCVRFPGCKGRYSEKEADEARRTCV